jgi:hypothetical protein
VQRQRGFFLFELIVVVLIATLLAVWSSDALVNRVNDSAAQASATWMLSVRKTAQAYIERYADTLKNAADPQALIHKGYADWSAPSLAELKADNLLSPGFPERGAGGLQVVVRILRSGICPDAACRLEALIHSAQAVTRRQTRYVDESMIAQWLIATQGWGGAVTRFRPDQVAGAAFALPNPPAADIGTLPVGTIAMAITPEQLALGDYLRVGDTRDPNFQNKATVGGDITARGSLLAQNYVHIGAQEQALTACGSTGAVARELYGGLLVCRGNKWRAAGPGGGGGFSINSIYGCRTSVGLSTANPATGLCTCPLDHEKVLISDSGPHDAPDGRTRGYLCV